MLEYRFRRARNTSAAPGLEVQNEASPIGAPGGNVRPVRVESAHGDRRTVVAVVQAVLDELRAFMSSVRGDRWRLAAQQTYVRVVQLERV